MTISASRQFIPGETTRSNRSPWTQRSHARRIEFRKSQARNCRRWGPGMEGTLCQMIAPDSCACVTTWLMEGKVCNNRRVLGYAAENRRHVLDGMRRDGEDAVPAVRHGKPRVFGAARGDPAEVCRIQRDAPPWSG